MFLSEIHMKKILLDNALESWSVAVKYCKYIKNGMVTLHYQKTFVSSLHNAIELFLKQIMIDNNEHRVANLLKVRNEKDALLQLAYYKSKDLSHFFKELNLEERRKFHSIGFSEVIDKSDSLLKDLLASININSIKNELKILQKLRNDETHFFITSNYLTEENFVKLHNLMIVIFAALQNYDLLPYWGIALDFSEFSHLNFTEKELVTFSYKNAVINSSIAKSLKEILSGSLLYNFSNNSFNMVIAEQYFLEIKEKNLQIDYDFNDVLAVIQALNKYGLIECQNEIVQYEDNIRNEYTLPYLELYFYY